MDSLIHQKMGLDGLNRVISRTVKIANTVPTPTLLNCLQSNQLTEWTLTVTETGLTTDAQLTITIRQENTSYEFKQPLNRGGSWTMQGWGSVLVQGEAINAGTVRLDLSLTPSSFVIPYVMVAGTSTSQTLTVAGAWVDLQSLANLTPAGYAPPFCKFVTIRNTANTYIRLLDSTGTSSFQAGPFIPTEPIWNSFRIFPWQKIQVAPVVALQRTAALWHN